MPDKFPYATVIVPTHDRAATLASAVASVQRQTVANIEILIVGDGPTPAIVAVAEALTSADPRIQFLAFDKAPLDAGLNVDRAIHQASSERIFYIDDDDIWLPAHVETIGPHLDYVHIADTLPVSVGTIAKGPCQQLHGFVNGGNSRIRRLLGANQLKLTFDTHIAHRKSSYIALGSPRAVTTTTSVTAMLAAFAADPRIRWRTLPTCTALSLHGAARIDLTPIERRAEIELWLARSACWTPEVLLGQADFVWHSMRTWFAEAPRLEDTVNSYLARYGVAWEASARPCAGDEQVALSVPLSEHQSKAVELAFTLFQGHPVGKANPDPLLASILDGVMGVPYRPSTL